MLSLTLWTERAFPRSVGRSCSAGQPVGDRLNSTAWICGSGDGDHRLAVPSGRTGQVEIPVDVGVRSRISETLGALGPKRLEYPQ
jgi:hypothetical protein